MYLELLNEQIYYYFENNDKPVVVYIHGLGGKAEFFEKFDDFTDKKYQILAFDLPGRGKSSWNNPLNVLLWLNTICEVLDKLNIKKFYLLAHSFGCYLASEIINMNKYEIMDNLFICPYNPFIDFNSNFLNKIRLIYSNKEKNDLVSLKKDYDSFDKEILKSFLINDFEHYLLSFDLFVNFIDNNFHNKIMKNAYLNAKSLNIVGGKNDQIVSLDSLDKLKQLNKSCLSLIDGEHNLMISNPSFIHEKLNEIVKK